MAKRKRSSSAMRPRKSLKTQVNTCKKKIRKLEVSTKDLRHNDFVIPHSSVGNVSFGTGALIIDPMASLVQGDRAVGEFDGNFINKLRLQVKFVMEGGSTEHDNVRAIVWVEKEYNITAKPPSLVNILHYGGQQQANSPWNRSRAGQYKILYNRHFVLTTADQEPSSTQVVTAATPHYKYMNLDIKIPRKYAVSKWDPTLAAFTTNRIFIAFLSDSAAINHPGPAGENGVGILFYDG